VPSDHGEWVSIAFRFGSNPSRIQHDTMRVKEEEDDPESEKEKG